VLTVNMHEAKSQLSKLVDAALAGEEVVIARAGKPAVRLVPAEPFRPLQLGTLKGTLPREVIESMVAPLPVEVIDSFYESDDDAELRELARTDVATP
jgi:prevent-host-death family protein